MSLIDKLKKNSRIKETAIITESTVYGNKDIITTDVPAINICLSGDVDGGLSPGLGVLAGPTKHFKTSFALVMGAAFQKKYKDGIILFYDSEFGSPQSYFENFGVDLERVVHTPIMNVEILKFDIMNQLEGLDKKDNVMIIIDSIGNLASKKEVEDAKDEKSVADMSRAKSLKSLFRIVTPYLKMKDIPMVAVNHTYMEIGMFPKAVVSGGTGIQYSSDWIWIVGRRQEKEGTEISGYHFVINIEKSRFVREKSKIPVSVSWEQGIIKHSGLMDIALTGEYLAKPSNGWYQKVDQDTGEMSGQKLRAKDIIDNDEFWNDMFETTDFKTYIKGKFSI